MPHNIMPEVKVLTAGPFHTVLEIEVSISPNPKDGEVYRVGGAGKDTQYALSKIALERLMIQAGIEETDSHAELVQERVWKAKWTGTYMQPEGKPIPLSGEKEIDLRVGGTRWTKRVEAEFDAKLKQDGVEAGVFKKDGWGYKVVKTNRWVSNEDLVLFRATLTPLRMTEIQAIAEAHATRYVTQAAQFGLEQAQTGARLRAVRSIMQIGTYTKDELKEPFVVFRSSIDREAMAKVFGEEQLNRTLAAQALQQLGVPTTAIDGLLTPPKQEISFDVEGEVVEPFDEEASADHLAGVRQRADKLTEKHPEYKGRLLTALFNDEGVTWHTLSAGELALVDFFLEQHDNWVEANFNSRRAECKDKIIGMRERKEFPLKPPLEGQLELPETEGIPSGATE